MRETGFATRPQYEHPAPPEPDRPGCGVAYGRRSCARTRPGRLRVRPRQPPSIREVSTALAVRVCSAAPPRAAAAEPISLQRIVTQKSGIGELARVSPTVKR